MSTQKKSLLMFYFMIPKCLGSSVLGSAVSLITQLSAALMCMQYVHHVVDFALEY